MEEQDRIEGQEDADVEAHKKPYQPLAAEDAPEGEDDGDDFELHNRSHKAL